MYSVSIGAPLRLFKRLSAAVNLGLARRVMLRLRRLQRLAHLPASAHKNTNRRCPVALVGRSAPTPACVFHCRRLLRILKTAHRDLTPQSVASLEPGDPN